MSCGEDHCITCGDVAVPMRVLGVDAGVALARCATDDGAEETVEVGLVDVAPGDAVLVHAGTALARLDEDGAP